MEQVRDMGVLEWLTLKETLTFEKRPEEGQRVSMQVSEGRVFPEERKSVPRSSGRNLFCEFEGLEGGQCDMSKSHRREGQRDNGFGFCSE